MSVRRPSAFALLSALVAIHLADDAFVQPPAGTSAADHLGAGLVPLSLLGLAVWRSPHHRPGTRAVTALAVGLTGLVTGGAEAGYAAATVGLSGDDHTGVLSALAGLALLGLGLHGLWRSRRRTGSRTRRWTRRAAKGVAVALTLQGAALPIGYAYVATHVARAVVPEPSLGAEHEDVTLRTSDGLQLRGWYVPSRNGAAVLVFPGRKGPQQHARMLVRHGYGVLLVDRRGEGASEGMGNVFGWDGERDVHAAVDFLLARADVEPGRIGGLGLSVGGELLLQAAAERTDLRAVVSEGAGTRSLAEERADFGTGEFLVTAAPLVLKQAALTVFADSTPPPTLLELLPRVAPRPVLLVWAPNSPNREGLNPTYARSVGPSAEVWALPDAAHVQGLQTRPQEYERRVVGFLDRALLG